VAQTQPNAGPTSPGFKGSGAAELLLQQLTAHRSQLTADCREPSAVWNEVVDVAVSEHVAPLLYKRFKENDAQALVPADAWKRLRRAYFLSGDRNTRLSRELGTVLQRLRDSGILVIVLKGAYLAEAVYGDVALRPMVDVDLLVRKTDLDRAQSILLDMGGFQQQPSRDRNRSLPPRHKGTKMSPDGNALRPPGGLGVVSSDSTGENAVHPVSGQPGGVEPDRELKRHALPVSLRDLAIELHWTIVSPTGPARIDDTGLWNRARPALIAGVEVLTLSPEDLLLHLCLHFCYEDSCVGLRSLCDVAETVQHFDGELDWPLVAERAREWGATRHVGLALHLAASMLGEAVPDDVVERLVPEGIDPRILEAAREAVLTQTGRHHWESLFRAQGARTLGEKAKFLKERIFLSRDEMAAKYPASRGSRYFYLYYALRLRDGLRAYRFHALRRARLMMQRRRRERHATLHDWLTRQ
jgi:hypothetical protein